MGNAAKGDRKNLLIFRNFFLESWIASLLSYQQHTKIEQTELITGKSNRQK